MASDNIASDDSVQFQFSTVRADANWQFATKNGTTQNLRMQSVYTEFKGVAN